MTDSRAPLPPDLFVSVVGEDLAAGRVPPDPVSVGEYRAYCAAFPEEKWRIVPPEKLRVELLGDLPDPHDEQDRAKAIATLLEHADEFGPIVQALAAGLGDSDA